MKVSELESYQSEYLSHSDLKGYTVEVTIATVKLEQLYSPAGSKDERITLSFKGKKKRLVLSKSRAHSMVAIAGDDTDHWPGMVIRLAPGRASNGQQTINILPPETKAASGDGSAAEKAQFAFDLHAPAAGEGGVKKSTTFP